MTEKPPQTYAGGCLCGAVEFEYRGPSLWCAHCHCSLCRRAHGAALVTWVGVDNNRFTLLNQRSLSWYRSSEDGERGFCSSCGSTLFFRSTRWPNEIHIARANIEGDIDIEPTTHVTYGSSEVTWFEFDDQLPHKTSGAHQDMNQTTAGE